MRFVGMGVISNFLERENFIDVVLEFDVIIYFILLGWFEIVWIFLKWFFNFDVCFVSLKG